VFKDLEKAEQFCHFQRQEWKYHKHSEKEMQKVHYEHQTGRACSFDKGKPMSESELSLTYRRERT
ncbi:hypothetical protein PZE06_28180, partial [Robertmurraya sp. DFI.2.37]|nr:hypothetical protein [Robertmurraya sp. DFI.2.37]